MTTHATIDWTLEARRPWWPHHEQRSGLTGFGDRPILHQSWRDPAADLPQSRRAGQDTSIAELDRFRSAA